MTLLAAFDVWFNLGMMAFFGVCLLLILMIMIQKPQGGGLSAAFGASSGSGQTAFGTKTGDALTVATIILFGVWIVVATVLNLAGNPSLGVAAPAVKAPTPVDNTKSETPAATPPANPEPTQVPPTNPAPTTPPESAPGTTPGTTPASTPGTTPPVTPPVTPPENPPAATPPAPTTPPAGDPPANPR